MSTNEQQAGGVVVTARPLPALRQLRTTSHRAAQKSSGATSAAPHQSATAERCSSFVSRVGDAGPYTCFPGSAWYTTPMGRISRSGKVSLLPMKGAYLIETENFCLMPVGKDPEMGSGAADRERRTRLERQVEKGPSDAIKCGKRNKIAKLKLLLQVSAVRRGSSVKRSIACRYYALESDAGEAAEPDKKR